MIKFLLLLIIFAVMFIFKIFASLVGTASVAINKRGTFINFGNQYLKNTRVCYSLITPYMGQLVDDIFAFAKERNYKLADETEFIETVLYRCVWALCPEEAPMVRKPQPMPHIEREAVMYSFQFLSKYNIKN
jgi:hypothetical protein